VPVFGARTNILKNNLHLKLYYKTTKNVNNKILSIDINNISSLYNDKLGHVNNTNYLAIKNKTSSQKYNLILLEASENKC
jgi:hypothetical protein